MSCGVPSRPTVRAGVLPPPATLTTTESVPSVCAAAIAVRTSASSVTSPPTATARFPELVGEGLRPLALLVEDRDTDPERDQVAHRRPTEPAGAPGHDRRPPGQLHPAGSQVDRTRTPALMPRWG